MALLIVKKKEGIVSVEFVLKVIIPAVFITGLLILLMKRIIGINKWW